MWLIYEPPEWNCNFLILVYSVVLYVIYVGLILFSSSVETRDTESQTLLRSHIWFNIDLSCSQRTGWTWCRVLGVERPGRRGVRTGRRRTELPAPGDEPPPDPGSRRRWRRRTRMKKTITATDTTGGEVRGSCVVSHPKSWNGHFFPYLSGGEKHHDIFVSQK